MIRSYMKGNNKNVHKAYLLSSWSEGRHKNYKYD